MSADLGVALTILRNALELPSKLDKKRLRTYRVQAQNLGDEIYFQIGMQAATPDKPLSAVADALMPLVHKLTLEVFEHSKPVRGKGRPAEDGIDPDYLMAVAYVAIAPKEKRRDVVRLCLEAGALKDFAKIEGGVRTTRSLDAHMHKIERELKKLEKRRAQAPPENVLIFRQPKKPRRKIKNI